jgi:hypothetical protein
MQPINIKIDRNIIILLCALTPILTFVIGRYTAPATPPPSVDEVCSTIKGERDTAKAAVEQLTTDLNTQKGLLDACQDGCDTRVRTRVDDKDAERKAAVVEAKRKQKDRYLEFKCSQCVRKGLCK